MITSNTKSTKTDASGAQIEVERTRTGMISLVASSSNRCNICTDKYEQLSQCYMFYVRVHVNLKLETGVSATYDHKQHQKHKDQCQQSD
jgi:hypothetical protein